MVDAYHYLFLQRYLSKKNPHFIYYCNIQLFHCKYIIVDQTLHVSETIKNLQSLRRQDIFRIKALPPLLNQALPFLENEAEMECHRLICKFIHHQDLTKVESMNKVEIVHRRNGRMRRSMEREAFLEWIHTLSCENLENLSEEERLWVQIDALFIAKSKRECEGQNLQISINGNPISIDILEWIRDNPLDKVCLF